MLIMCIMCRNKLRARKQYGIRIGKYFLSLDKVQIEGYKKQRQLKGKSKFKIRNQQKDWLEITAFQQQVI